MEIGPSEYKFEFLDFWRQRPGRWSHEIGQIAGLLRKIRPFAR